MVGRHVLGAIIVVGLLVGAAVAGPTGETAEALFEGYPFGGGPADLNQDGVVDFPDVYEFLVRFAAGSPSVDQTFDREFDFSDALLYLQRFEDGCPG